MQLTIAKVLFIICEGKDSAYIIYTINLTLIYYHIKGYNY